MKTEHLQHKLHFELNVVWSYTEFELFYFLLFDDDVKRKQFLRSLQCVK